MDKYFYRNIYNLIDSRVIRVAAINLLRILRRPYYRIGLDTNNLCNLRCIMCYLSINNFSQKPEVMSIDFFTTLAKDLFNKVAFLDLSCSYEPLMTKNFIDYLRIAKKHCPGHISICTNGILLTEKIIDDVFKENLLNEITISIDGLTPQTYNSIRVGGDFTKLIKILELIRYGSIHYHTKIILRLNYTMMRRNIEELNKLHDFARAFCFDQVQLRHLRLISEFNELYDESLYYYQDLSDRVLNKVINDFESDSMTSLMTPPLFGSYQFSNAKKKNCAYPWFNFTINCYGDVNLCNIGYIGNLRNCNLYTLERSIRVKSIRKELIYGDSNKLCSSCFFVNDLTDIKKRSSFIREDINLDTIKMSLFDHK